MTKSQIHSLLSRDSGAVCRAMVVLLSRQTAEEQSSASTHESNGRGFSLRPIAGSTHATYGTYLAHWVLGLTTVSFERWCRGEKTPPAYVAYFIRQFLANRSNVGTALTGYHLTRGREMACYYWRQLADEAAKVRQAQPVVVRGADMSYLLAQHDRFQRFAG